MSTVLPCVWFKANFRTAICTVIADTVIRASPCGLELDDFSKNTVRGVRSFPAENRNGVAEFAGLDPDAVSLDATLGRACYLR